jgi:hypothetical protein
MSSSGRPGPCRRALRIRRGASIYLDVPRCKSRISERRVHPTRGPISLHSRKPRRRTLAPTPSSGTSRRHQIEPSLLDHEENWLASLSGGQGRPTRAGLRVARRSTCRLAPSLKALYKISSRCKDVSHCGWVGLAVALEPIDGSSGHFCVLVRAKLVWSLAYPLENTNRPDPAYIYIYIYIYINIYIYI